jgi:hypothetical protein
MKPFARNFLLSFLFLGLLATAATYYVNEKFAFLIAASVILMAATFVMAPQIDWWWYKKHPQDIDLDVMQSFEKHLDFYKNLDEKDRLRFRQRVGLYLMSVEFMVPSKDEEKQIPEHYKYWVSAFAVMTTWGKEIFTFEKYEKIVGYMQPFPSPLYTQYFHSCETFDDENDGVLLFAFEPMMNAVLNPLACFNPILYEYCKLFTTTYWSKKSDFDESHWSVLEKISSFSEAKIKETIGLPNVDVRAVAMSFYLTFPQQFNRFLPEEAETMKEIFGF